MWFSIVLCLALVTVSVSAKEKPDKLTHNLLEKLDISPETKATLTKAREACVSSTKIKAKFVNYFEAVGGKRRPELGAFLTCVFRNIKTMNEKGEWVPSRVTKLLSGKVLANALACDRPASKGNDTSDETMLDVYECLVKNYRNK